MQTAATGAESLEPLNPGALAPTNHHASGFTQRYRGNGLHCRGPRLAQVVRLGKRLGTGGIAFRSGMHRGRVCDVVAGMNTIMLPGVGGPFHKFGTIAGYRFFISQQFIF